MMNKNYKVTCKDDESVDCNLGIESTCNYNQYAKIKQVISLEMKRLLFKTNECCTPMRFQYMILWRIDN